VGHRYTRASEFLHADLNLRQAAIVLELRVIGHVASRIFGSHRSERDSIESNLRFAPRPHSPALIPVWYNVKIMAHTVIPDQPGPDAGIMAWARYLSELEKLPQDDEGVQFAIQGAMDIIAEPEWLEPEGPKKPSNAALQPTCHLAIQ